jgi:hypothetical protein
MSTLNLNDYTPNIQNIALPVGDQLAKAQQVRTLGIIAVILAVIGIVVPFIANIAAFLLAKRAMNISRQYLVPIEYEKPAYWAYRVGLTGILLWVVILIRVIL